MTRTKQNMTVRTDAVELNDAALDRAAGGGADGTNFTIQFSGSFDATGSGGALKTTSGRT